jgi:hypothetical protein
MRLINNRPIAGMFTKLGSNMQWPEATMQSFKQEVAEVKTLSSDLSQPRLKHLKNLKELNERIFNITHQK